MPNDLKPLANHLHTHGIGRQREAEILRELSEHVEDDVATLESQGLTSAEATRRALGSVHDWRQLGKAILAAEMEETMNHRTRALWLPALGAVFASSALTAIIQVCAPLTHAPWLNPLITVRPGYFPWYELLLPWVALQPLVGAVGASWSRRADGSLREQLIAALAPAIPYIALLLIRVVLTILQMLLVAMHRSGHLSGRVILLNLAFSASWALLPALALLIGAAPFLRRPQPQA
jgi:hypothetical protein